MIRIGFWGVPDYNYSIMDPQMVKAPIFAEETLAF